MSWIDDLQGKHVMINGVLVPDRKNFNFVTGAGATLTVVDNTTLGSTDVTIGIPTYAGIDPLAPKVGGGYPSATAYAVSAGVTFIRAGGASAGDSVRMFGAGVAGDPALAAFMTGIVTNVTAVAIDFYPYTGNHIYLNGTDLGLNVALSLAPGTSVRWAIDASLNTQISV